MFPHHGIPFVARPGDVLVELPHTLTTGTRAALEARARAALPSVTSLSRTAPDARLVLDARGCAVIDDAGLSTLATLRRAAAAAAVDIVVVDAPPALAAWLAAGRSPVMPLAFRDDAPRPMARDDDDEARDGRDAQHVAAASAASNDPPEPGVLPLDDAARARLAARRRR